MLKDIILDEAKLKGAYPTIHEELKEYINQINNKIIPERTPSSFTQHMDPMDSNYFELMIHTMGLREYLIKQWGYVLLDKQWIRGLSQYIGNKKCLEVMAGTGSLTYALKEFGTDIVATDDFSWRNRWIDLWTEVIKMDAIESIETYKPDYIIMSWAYMDDTAYKCLLKMREINPKCKLIFIGEGHGGCTANDEFFETAIETKGSFYIPSHFGIHDRLVVYK